MRIFPIGREGPEGKINRAGRENCQSIVQGQRSEDLTPLAPENTKLPAVTQSKFRSRRSLQSGLISKKSWSVQTAFTMERTDIRYALAEVVRDESRRVESLQ